MSNTVQYTINIGGNAGQQVGNISAGISSLTTAADNLNNSFGRIGMRLAMFNQVTDVIGKVSGAFGDLVGSSLEFEKQQANIRTLLKGDTKAADELIDKLGQFATKTVYDRSSLVEAQKTMMAFGLNADFAYGKLLNIGDIALGDKEKMKSLALAFAQATSTGKLMGQDLLQMINAGFNPLEVISRKTGQSIADLKDQMSKGQISAEMLAQAFEWATAEGEQFYKGAEAAGQTTAGRIEQVKGQIDNFKIALFQATGGATAWIAEFSGMLQPMASLLSILPLVQTAFVAVKVKVVGAVVAMNAYNATLAVGNVQNLGFVKSTIQAVIALGRLATVGLWNAIKSMGFYIASLVTGKTTSIAFAAASSTAFGAFATAASIACKAVSVAIFSIPIVGWIALAITAVGALFAYLYNKCDKFAAHANAIWAATKALFTGENFKEAYDAAYKQTLKDRQADRANESDTGINASLADSLTNKGGDVVPQAVSQKTDSAVTGGTRNNNITINVSKFLENIIYEGGVADNAEDLESRFKEMLLRTIYQAQIS